MRFVQFASMLAKRLGCEVALFEAASYDELSRAVVSRYVDVAWLPPIPFVTLLEHRAVVPLVNLRRGGRARFRAAIIARGDSAIARPSDLVGKRAAWVDPSSASGFVVPRVALDELGVDPRTSFPKQRFFHAHELVARAVLGGLADFGATYAGVSESGEITRGPWSIGESAQHVRVIALVGDIPGDVVAANASLDASERDALCDALLKISRDKRSKLLAHGAFGLDEFARFEPGGYDELARAVRSATERGLLAVPARADESGAFTLR